MITIKQNDYGIVHEATITRNGSAIDVTDYDVKFVFGDYELMATKTDAPGGKVQMVFQEIHTVNLGIYKGEFKLSDDSLRETVPNDSYEWVEIKKEAK